MRIGSRAQVFHGTAKQTSGDYDAVILKKIKEVLLSVEGQVLEQKKRIDWLKQDL